MRVVLLLCGLLLTACGGSQPAETAERDSIPSETVYQPDTLWQRYSPRLRTLLGPETGIVRGVEFGMTTEEVKELETTSEPFEETGKLLAYEVPLDELQTADVQYHFNSRGQLTKCVIEPFLNRQSAVDSLFAETRAYFNDRYGPSAAEQPKKVRWQAAGLRTELEDVGVAKALGLRITLAQEE